jgi:hypothetical protein
VGIGSLEHFERYVGMGRLNLLPPKYRNSRLGQENPESDRRLPYRELFTKEISWKEEMLKGFWGRGFQIQYRQIWNTP